MTEEEILQLIQDNTPEQSPESIQAVAQYNPATHAINNKNIYPDKTVFKPLLDQNGNQILVNDEKQYQRTIVKRNRIAIPMQQTIVSLHPVSIGIIINSIPSKFLLLLLGKHFIPFEAFSVCLFHNLKLFIS